MRHTHHDREKPHPLSDLASLEYIRTDARRHAIYRATCAVCGHVWEASKYKLEHHYCKECSIKNRKISLEEYNDEGSRKGIKLQNSILPKDINQFTNWVCEKGHIFSASFAMIRNAARPCPTCRQTNKLYETLDSIEDYFPLSHPVSMDDRILWTCYNGHIFSSTPALISNLDKCPLCADAYIHVEHIYMPKGAYYSLGELRNLAFIGDDIPETPDIPVAWVCVKCYSILEASYNEVLKNKVCCHKCTKPKNNIVNGKKVSVPQKVLFNKLPYADKFLNEFVAGRCADIVLFNNRVIIEYDGKAYHTEEKDKFRNEDYIKAGWRLLILKSGCGGIPTMEDIENWIDSLDTNPLLEIDLDVFYGDALKMPYSGYKPFSR